jgi:2-desacetyl-2-hydroxyethyl bacteriochlorophyllide A dehydrogenase
MKARQLWFIEPGKVEIREKELGALASDEVLVKTKVSGISAGTEMLAYRGQLPEGLDLDVSIKAFEGLDATYPLPYGYACVGYIEETGSAVDKSLKGKKIFAFQPHASYFMGKPQQLIFLPEEVSEEAGIFLANMETAVNFFIDGVVQPKENIAIIGMGVVGQLLNAVLNQYAVKGIAAIDLIKARRLVAENEELTSGFAPDSKHLREATKGFDLIFEISGNPEALNFAIEIAGFAGRIIVGSWYGNKSTQINLGGAFHRNRLKIIGSQVSTINPELAEEWTKEKLLQKATTLIAELNLEKYISHRFPLSQADQAYRLLDKKADKALQVILTYED